MEGMYQHGQRGNDMVTLSGFYWSGLCRHISYIFTMSQRIYIIPF